MFELDLTLNGAILSEMKARFGVLIVLLVSTLFATRAWSPAELERYQRSYQPQWLAQPEALTYRPRRLNYLKRIKWVADFVAQYQVSDSTSPDFGGIIEAEHLPNIVETDNTQEAIWVWSRWYEITGQDDYQENIQRAWSYVLSHPAYQEHSGNPAYLWYAVWNCGLGMMTEAQYRRTYRDSSYIFYADSCRNFYLASPLNEANFLDIFVTAQSAGMAYEYARERNDSVLMDTALARGIRVKNWITADPAYRLGYQTWAMSGGTAFWGVAKTYCRADTVAGKAWVETYIDSLPGFYPSGNWNCSHNIWLAYAYRAAGEILNDTFCAQLHQYLTDTLLMKDTDLDGGIPATWSDPNNQDQTWVSTYLVFMGMDGLIDTIYSEDVAVYEFLAPAPNGLYVEPCSLCPVVPIENVGKNPISGTVYCQVGSQEQSAAVINLPVWKEETLAFAFPQPLSGGVHQLRAFFSADENPKNDSVFLEFKVYRRCLLSGQLLDSLTGEPISAQVQAYLGSSPLVWDSTDTDTSGKFTLNLIDSIFKIAIDPKPPYYRRVWTVAITGDTAVEFRTQPAELLIVNNDTLENYTDYYTTTLDTLGLTWSLWRRRSFGPVPEHILTPIRRRTVVWFTGNSHTQTVPDPDRLQLVQFLSSGGNLIFTGQNIAEELAGTPFLESVIGCRFDSSGYRGFLVFGNRQDSVGKVIIGTATAGGQGANNQNSRDIITPLGDAVKFLVYDTITNLGAGIRRQISSNARVIFLGFGFEAVNRPASRPNYFNRVQLMNTMLSWLFTGTGIGEEGADRLQVSTFAVSPKLFKTSLFITINHHARVSLFDITGRRVAEISLLPGKTVWNPGLIPPGVYFIITEREKPVRVVKVK